MKRYVPPLLLILFGSVMLVTQQPAVHNTTAAESVTVEIETETDNPPAPTDVIGKLKARRGLGIIERRRLGLTIGNMRRVVQEMQAAGELDDPELTQSVLAAMVYERLVEENPKAFKNPSLDFDEILALIERLLPIILMLVELFSYAPAAGVGALACAFCCPNFRRFLTYSNAA